jgi:hypothetical protein
MFVLAALVIMLVALAVQNTRPVEVSWVSGQARPRSFGSLSSRPPLAGWRHCHPPQHPPSLTHRLVDVHGQDNARSRETLASIPFDDDHATVEAAYRALPSDSP